jgi:asparagine synthase (glutamine-hydrolysing)
MGSLFGYCGKPAPDLLAGMATQLSHRSALGYEQVVGKLHDHSSIEIGHGIARWCQKAQVAKHHNQLLGYAGTLFQRQVKQNNHLNDAEQLLTELQPGTEKHLEQLEGAFVMALAVGETFYLVRDHAGVKAIYWTIHQGRLLFASEIKALFAEPSLPRRMRPGALLEYFSFSFVPGAATMFENIQELQPGTILTFSNGQAKVRRHFQFEKLEWQRADGESLVPTQCQYHTQVESVRAALQASVEQCCQVSRNKTPAVFLSGGIDSSAILAMTADKVLPDKTIPTFSVHFGAEYPNENEFISLMVERYRTEHHWIDIRPADFIAELHDIVWYLDDPIGDPVTVPNYLMAKAAAKVTDVVLNGEGGDPCFGGPKNIPMFLAQLYGPTESKKGWLERNYLHSFQRGYSDLKSLVSPALFKEAGGEEALVALLEPFFNTNTPQAFLNKLMCMNIRLKGANLILVKVDKMTSANGLLALPPLFSRQIIETSMACPPALKLNGAIEKVVLKKAVQDIVPAAIIERPKSGMMVPVRFWFQRDMRRYAKKLLSEKRIKRVGLFNPDYVKRLLNYDIEGVHGMRHGLKLWMLITFMLWYEQMVEKW